MKCKNIDHSFRKDNNLSPAIMHHGSHHGYQRSRYLNLFFYKTQWQNWIANHERNIPIHISQITEELQHTSLNLLEKKALAEVSCHSFLPPQQRQTKNNVSTYLIHLFMRVIEILTQLLRHWKPNVLLSQCYDPTQLT